MMCPKDQSPMHQVDRLGVTIDQCSSCRGIFLDHGELEQFESALQGWQQQTSYQPPPAYAPPPPQPAYGYHGHGGHHGYGRPHRKKGFFGELFD